MVPGMDKTVSILSSFGCVTQTTQVLFPQDLCALEQGSSIIASANSDAQWIILHALVAREIAMTCAYEEGAKASQIMAASEMAKIARRNIKHLDELKNDIADIIAKALHHLVGSLHPADLITGHIGKLIARLQDQERLVINVSPDNENAVRERIQKLQESFPQIKRIDVAPDPELGMDSCIIESPVGRINSNLSSQIEIILEHILMTDDVSQKGPQADDA